MSYADALIVGCGVLLVLLAPQAWAIGALYIGLGAMGDQ